jgi:thiamine-phosphate pyrophosphorylase
LRKKKGDSVPLPLGEGPAKPGERGRILRVLDVNLNRAREGLRVLEDTARLVWEDETLFREFRALRHALDKVTRAAYPRLVLSRDSAGDPGRTIPETSKRAWKGLVAANFRRAQEALRVLEEYGKVLGPRHAPRFKSLRYRLYTLETSCFKKS